MATTADTSIANPFTAHELNAIDLNDAAMDTVVAPHVLVVEFA